MQTRRRRRVADLIKSELSHIIQQELRDPRIGFITITEVNMSPDLLHAKIYISILGNKEKVESSLKGLKSSVSFLRREICQQLRLRYCPTLDFCLDTSIEYGTHIEELIEKLKKEQK